MDEFSKALELSDLELVGLAGSFKEFLHTKLVLGQTRHVCRYGTLSDGHEKITPSQRYYQAIKEMYYLSGNISQQKVSAMKAQADLLDAEEELENAKKQSAQLRAKANILYAKDRIKTSLITIEDQLRMLDEYNQIRLELEPGVDAQYPLGIEQAERDNWMAVAKYRAFKEQTKGLPRELMFNVPLSPMDKADLGVGLGRPDMIAPLAIENEDVFAKLNTKDPDCMGKFIDMVRSKNSKLELIK